MNAIQPYLKIIENITRHYKENKKITIFEIGVRRGMSTETFLKGILNRKNYGELFSCDPVNNENVIRDIELKKYWTFINEYSYNVQWNKEIDILFIDGEHTYNAVKQDYEKFEPFVKKDGIILMHDMIGSECSEYWQEIKYSKILLKLNSAGLGIIIK